MRKRTKAREAALKILYAVDITGDDPKACIERYWRGESDRIEGDIVKYADLLVIGTSDNISRIDMLLSKYAQLADEPHGGNRQEYPEICRI